MAIRGRFVLDDVSRAIIEQLQEDGRRPYARIATAVGCRKRPWAARRAAGRRRSDVDLAVTDPLQVGFSRQAMVAVRTSGDARVVADELAELPEVDYVVIAAGADGRPRRGGVRGRRPALRIARIRAVPGVQSTETFCASG